MPHYIVGVYRYLEYSWVRKFYSVLQDIVCTALYCSTWYYEQVPLLEYRFGHFSQLGSGISQIGSRVLNLVHLNLVETGPTGTAVAILKF